MIDCEFFCKTLARYGINFFVGVPDSLLESFCAYVADHADQGMHIIAANEGGAIALACGYYLATGKVGLVYMQNSGEGNAVNPLVSLADTEVYSIPILILVGWRGEPGKHDEPQHIKQGKITLSLLDVLGLPYEVLPDKVRNVQVCLHQIINGLKQREGPAALIVKKGTFKPYKLEKREDLHTKLSREEVIKTIVDNLDKSAIIVSTTGKISRELYEYREHVDGDHIRDFLSVGSMGHCSQIAMGIALAKPEKHIYCFDGDGALLMHMGAMAIIGSHRIKNFTHIVFNNGSHDSVGGQPTCGFDISVTGIAKACGYTLALQAETRKQVLDKMKIIRAAGGPTMLEVRVGGGARKELGRPNSSLQESKREFMEFLAT